MELRRLREFVALAEELHFARAASRLQMDQGPLSRRIKQLERMLGVTLFARTSQGTQLTPRGEALLPYARTLIAENEHARRMLKEPLVSNTVRLRLRWSEDLPLRQTMLALDDFARSTPEILVEVSEASFAQTCEDLRFALIDVGLAFVRPNDPELASSIVWDERGCAVLPISHPLATREALALRELGEGRLFLLGHASRKSWVAKRLETILFASIDEPQLTFIDRLRVLLALVHERRGVGIVGPGEAEMIQQVDFAVIPLSDIKAQFSTFAINAAKNPPPAVAAFIAAVRSKSNPSMRAEMPDPGP